MTVSAELDLGTKPVVGAATIALEVDGVVEDHDAAVPEQRVFGDERLVVHRDVEPRSREVRAEGAADLDGPHRPAAAGASTEVVHEIVEGDAERGLDDPAPSNVAPELEHLRTP